MEPEKTNFLSGTGKIEECLGKECPTPCCQIEAYLFPEELPYVLGCKATGLITRDESEARTSIDKVFINKSGSYVKHCLAEDCKFDQNNPEAEDNCPQKGIICVVCPLFITAHDFGHNGFIRLDILPPNLCPLTDKKQVISKTPALQY